jgi:hypothetical protein
VVKVKIYVEGGGDNRRLKTACRQGFREFLEKAADFTGKMPAIVACGSRQSAYDDFCTALKNVRPGDFAVLLVDSEDAVTEDDAWRHLKQRDNWNRPTAATDDQAHLMVQCMESWFLADRETLAEFFGQGFSENALPGERRIEQIPKNKVFDALNAATRGAKSKGVYSKGKHSFDLLAKIDADKVLAASKHAEHFVATLLRKCGE